MHMLFVYLTQGPIKELDSETGGGTQSLHTNALVKENFPSDFTDVTITFRLRGELDLRGAQVYFQIWGTVDGISSGYTLTGQPITVTSEWSEQTIRCTPDPEQWTAMGGRHDRSEPPARTAPGKWAPARKSASRHAALEPAASSPRSSRPPPC